MPTNIPRHFYLLIALVSLVQHPQWREGSSATNLSKHKKENWGQAKSSSLADLTELVCIGGKTRICSPCLHQLLWLLIPSNLGGKIFFKVKNSFKKCWFWGFFCCCYMNSSLLKTGLEYKSWSQSFLEIFNSFRENIMEHIAHIY